jgi:alkanesulfonate monooxygenase SsuD/methylene tetrahydromethanopterin reductase-like flavin-dependent oxidoreductase (luciferase family)
VFVLGERHSHEFAVDSPAVVLAGITGQTKRIRLASGVTGLSALDPVRVYEDFAQLAATAGPRRAGHGTSAPPP